MDTNIFSINENLNLGDVLVLWIRKVYEIKTDKTGGSAKNEQPSNDQHTNNRSAIRTKRNERLERKKIW